MPNALRRRLGDRAPYDKRKLSYANTFTQSVESHDDPGDGMG